MRPRVLDEYVGQGHILGEGRLLRRAIQADQLSSLIFYGPPGTGKTTLAMVIANTTRAHFISINAVLAGVKEIREAIANPSKTQVSITKLRAIQLRSGLCFAGAILLGLRGAVHLMRSPQSAVLVHPLRR